MRKLNRNVNFFLGLLVFIAIPHISFAKKYIGLKVKGDYRILDVKVKEIQSNDLGITSDLIKEIAQAHLVRNKFKPLPNELREQIYHYLEIKVTISRFENYDNDVFSINLNLTKLADSYDVNREVAGDYFVPKQGEYFAIGNVNQRQLLLQILEFVVDEFIGDYIKSNVDSF